MPRTCAAILRQSAYLSGDASPSTSIGLPWLRGRVIGERTQTSEWTTTRRMNPVRKNLESRCARVCVIDETQRRQQYEDRALRMLCQTAFEEVCMLRSHIHLSNVVRHACWAIDHHALQMSVSVIYRQETTALPSRYYIMRVDYLVLFRNTCDSAE